MSRKSVLTPRMQAEIALAEAASDYKNAHNNVEHWRREKVKAAELIVNAERNLASISKLYDEAFALKRRLANTLNQAEEEFAKLESEHAARVDAKLLESDDES